VFVTSSLTLLMDMNLLTYRQIILYCRGQW